MALLARVLRAVKLIRAGRGSGTAGRIERRSELVSSVTVSYCDGFAVARTSQIRHRERRVVLAPSAGRPKPARAGVRQRQGSRCRSLPCQVEGRGDGLRRVHGDDAGLSRCSLRPALKSTRCGVASGDERAGVVALVIRAAIDAPGDEVTSVCPPGGSVRCGRSGEGGVTDLAIHRDDTAPDQCSAGQVRRSPGVAAGIKV